MNADRIASMRIPGRAIAFDCETHWIQKGLLAPPLVCASIAAWSPEQGVRGELLDKDQALEAFTAILRDDTLIIVGANIAYDMLVMAVHAARRGVDMMPLIFDAYRSDRVFDLQLAEMLHLVALGMLGKDPRTGGPLRDPITGKIGRCSLSIVTDLVLDRKNAKVNDEYRSRYHELEDVPIADWPRSASEYPVDDAVNTLEVALAQVGMLPSTAPHDWDPVSDACLRCGVSCSLGTMPPCWVTRPRRNLHDLAIQCYTAFALHLGAAWGVRTDPVAVEELAAAVDVGRVAGLPTFTAAGFLRADGSEDGSIVKRAVAVAYGCTGTCPACAGTGKINKKFSKRDPSKPVGKPINCAMCSSTGLDLDTAPVPRTDPSTKFPVGQVQTGRDILTESGDEFLMEYGTYLEDDKIADTYVPFLREGTIGPINLRPNVILETGRVSYEGNPIQLLPRMVSARLSAVLKARGSDVIGVRDCCTPRRGWLYYSNDYSGGELVTFAESCVIRVGYSKMGEALNAGIDVHSALGATMMNAEYGLFLEMLKGKHDDAAKVRAKSFRQAAKPANFGFPGGMGAVKMVLQQRKQGPDTEWPDGPSDLGAGKRGYKGLRFCVLIGGSSRCGESKVTEYKNRPCPPTCLACIHAAERIRETWFAQWPEARPYFAWHSSNVDSVGEVTQHYSGRIRGGVDFCSEANGDFQALLADIAKRAQCRVSFEQYVDRGTALYGTRSILFSHDELFGEAPEAIAAEASERVTEIMVEEFRKACPNHAAACKAEPTLMRKWFKAAECVRDDNGRLIPWEPKQ